DNAAMWVWQKATGLWEPDPATPANLGRANFTGIAFNPSRPTVASAAGQQGLVLPYGRTWPQEALPEGVPPAANFTSIAYAGGEALATWKMPVGTGSIRYVGGVIANSGSGWHVEEAATQAVRLGERSIAPQAVSGLPDGGAVIALDGADTQVIE